MRRHRAGQLRMTGTGQPGRRAVTMAEVVRRVVGRERLVDIVEQRRRLDEPAIDDHAARLDASRQPARDLGHGARVAQEPGWGIEGEQQGGGLHPPGHRHRLDGTRRRPRVRDAAWSRCPTRPGPERPRCSAGVGDQPGDRDRTQERQAAIGARAGSGLTEEAQRGRRYRHARRPRGIGLDVGRRNALGSNRHLARLEADDDRAVAVRSEDSGACRGEPIQRRLGRVAIWVAGARRGHRHLRPGCLDEGFRRRGLAAVVRHLEQVDLRQSLGQERWVDALLDITHQEHPARADLAEQHDGDVVDGRAAVRAARGEPGRGSATGRAG